MRDWKASFTSTVNPRFLFPFPPEHGSSHTVFAQVAATDRLRSVVCHVVADGRSRYYRMRKISSFHVDRYAVEVEASHEPVWRFSFQLETDEGWFFFARRGIQSFHPAESRMFAVDDSLQLDDWVPQATFYQIFPDRFRKGNPDTGVRDGEYVFDGHKPTVRVFGETPPRYNEGWCLDFYNGDLKGIQDAIPHFIDLGVTALYLNPIFRARTNHRYDCIDFFHVDEHLGGDEALADLVGALHRTGIRCMLDVSLNHTGSDHPWFRKALEDADAPEAAFYYRETDGSFRCWQDVHTLPQLNYGNENLRDLMWRREDSVVRRFLGPPFTIDAWRFDVGTETGRNGDDQMCHDIWREVRHAVKETKPDAYIIGEAWEDACAYLRGDQWDSAMNYFGSGRLLRRWYGQQDTFLMEHWGHSDESGRPLSGTELAEALTEHLLSLPDQLVYRQFNLLDSHDTMRLHNHGRLFDWDLYRGVVMMLYVLPGAPNIYYGDEIGLDGTIESNEGARYPMEWDRSAWDMRFFDLYRRLGALRKAHACLGYGNYGTLYADEDTMVFYRSDEREAIVMVLNRASEPKLIVVDGWPLGLQSAADWETGEDLVVKDYSIPVELNIRESRLLICTPVS